MDTAASNGASPAPPRLLWLAGTLVPGALSHLGSLLIMHIPRACFQTTSSTWLGWGPWKQHFYRLLREFWSRCYVNHSWINDTEEFLLGPHYTSYNSLPAGKPHRSSCFFTPSSPQPRGCFAKGTLESWPEPMFPSGPSYVLRNRGVQRRPGPMYTAELPEQCVLWRGPPGKGLRGLLVAVSSPWSAAE